MTARARSIAFDGWKAPSRSSLTAGIAVATEGWLLEPATIAKPSSAFSTVFGAAGAGYFKTGADAAATAHVGLFSASYGKLQLDEALQSILGAESAQVDGGLSAEDLGKGPSSASAASKGPGGATSS